MMGRTGLYRVRKGLFGKCILQYESVIPRSAEEGGGVITVWTDEQMVSAPPTLIYDRPRKEKV